ncbi:MAG: hypothetical protein ACD_75C01964G0018 [uncultured bacterium]|nr:MAG: hypothetical protein ACD_75C01964G0018 [uncultured bacterium]
MDKTAGQQPDVLERIHRHIALSEEKRSRVRFEHNLAALARGSFQVLGNDEFVSDLAEYLPEKYPQAKDQNRKILIALSDAVVSGESRIRERTLPILSLAALHSLQRGEKGEIFILVHGFCKWLEFETDVLPGLAVVMKRIEELSAWLLEMSYWKDAEKIIALLHRILSGELEKSAAIRSLAGKTLCNLAAESLIERLTDRYLAAEHDQEICKEILLHLGVQTTGYLLHRAIRSFNRRERLALIGLLPLTTSGTDALPVFEESLQQNPPWTVVRNIISIVAETRAESSYPLLQQYFSHEDSRVQHEMIGCVVKLGGNRMKDRLLHGLGVVNDSLKIYIIRMLAELEGRDESVLSALCALCDAAAKRSVGAANSANGLLGAIATALRAFPDPKSIDVLSSLRRQYEKMPASDHLLLQIDQTLKILRPQLRHNRQRPDNREETVSFDSDPLQQQIAFNKTAKIEEEVRKLIRQGERKGAGEFLYKHALAAGREKDFVTAEMLRDRMLEIDPMALAEVVELGEWIEEQKTTLIGAHHIEIWNNLYEEMATEEFNALYQGLRHEDYRKGDLIVQAGESDESLYFVNSGFISLNCVIGDNEHFLKRMGPSDVLGSEQFFSASVWTVSLKALSDVQVQVLDKVAFRTIAENFPEFEEKLRRYCKKFANVPELLKMSGGDRREYPRFPLTLLTKNYLRDPYGTQGSRSFNGELVDISRNGLAFAIKISSRNKTRLLLGRQIVSVIQTEGESLVQCNGVVVGVRIHDAAVQHYTVHVKFSRNIDDIVFKQIVSMVQ